MTSSLIKDIHSNNHLYRGNAIRVLSKITDGTMLAPVDQYIKQAISMDGNPLVAIMALVSGLHFVKEYPNLVRRWVNEAQQAVKSDNNMVQFHALALLYSIKQRDRHAIFKLVTQLTRSGIRSPLAFLPAHSLHFWPPVHRIVRYRRT